MDIFGNVFDMVSEVVMSVLVLMLANGWFTRFKKVDYDDHIEFYGPMMVIVGMIHIMMAALIYVDQDAYHKYHDFHGWPGYIVITIKMVLVAVYMYFYSWTKDKISKEAKVFYNKIVPLGLMYLLSDPFTILTSFFLEEYNR